MSRCDIKLETSDSNNNQRQQHWVNLLTDGECRDCGMKEEIRECRKCELPAIKGTGLCKRDTQLKSN